MDATHSSNQGISIKIESNGDVFLGDIKVSDPNSLREILVERSKIFPKPKIEIQVANGAYFMLGKVLFQTQVAEFPEENIKILES